MFGPDDNVENKFQKNINKMEHLKNYYEDLKE